MLHSLRFPLKWSAAAPPRIEVWKPSDAHNPAEGERHLVSGDYPEAERCLTEALADVGKYGYDRSMQVRLPLLLAQAQREQSKLDSAEETARAALAIAVQSKDLSLYTQCLDGLADVYKVQENFPALEAVAGEALHIEQSLARPDPKRLAGRMRHLGLAQNRNGRPGEGLASLENALTLQRKSVRSGARRNRPAAARDGRDLWRTEAACGGAEALAPRAAPPGESARAGISRSGGGATSTGRIAGRMRQHRRGRRAV